MTIFIDNSARQAPTEFNGHDMLEVTRRIEREAGSAYRINGREVRARDVRILFEDAATGARSPALVRQGQIGELVNAKPEQRRRILEDAAGIAGLHSRRHEAELRLRAADGNLSRLNDILGQLNSQIESLKRQAREARRYKEVSAEIRKLEAVVFYLQWAEAQGQVDAEEADLAAALEKVGRATEAEAKAIRAEADAAGQLQPLRDQEAAKGAILSRFRIEQENLEREAQRTADRQRELEARVEQLSRDMAREQSLIAEAKETVARLEAETVSLANTARLAGDFEQKALAAHDEAESRPQGRRGAPERAHHRHGRSPRPPPEPGDAEARAPGADRQARAPAHRARRPDARDRRPRARRLQAQGRRRARPAADGRDRQHRGRRRWRQRRPCRPPPPTPRPRARPPPRPASPPASSRPRSRRWPSCSRRPATAACRRCSTRSRSRRATRWRSPPRWATTSTRRSPPRRPCHWRLNAATEADPALPAGVEPLVAHVEGPPELTRRLRQIGVVAAADGTRLQRTLRPGQRLVSTEGHLWRWDGFVAAAEVSTAAATRLAERSRLGALAREEAEVRRAAEAARAAAETAAERLGSAQAEERRLRQLWREAQTKVAQTRDVLTAMERQARETEAKIAAVTDAKGRTQEALVEAHSSPVRDRGGAAGAGRHGSSRGRSGGRADRRRRSALARHREPHRAHHARARASRPHRAASGHRARARALEDPHPPAPTSRSPR